MFGKGVYFADCFSKSFNYTNCFAAGGEMAQHHTCMFLAEVRALCTKEERKRREREREVERG